MDCTHCISMHVSEPTEMIASALPVSMMLRSLYRAIAARVVSLLSAHISDTSAEGARPKCSISMSSATSRLCVQAHPIPCSCRLSYMQYHLVAKCLECEVCQSSQMGKCLAGLKCSTLSWCSMFCSLAHLAVAGPNARQLTGAHS